MTKPVLLYLAASGAALVALRFAVIFLEPRLTFFPLRGLTATPQQLSIPFEEVAVRTYDRETLCAWFIDRPQAKTEIVFFHGNGGNLSGYLEIFADFHRQGFAVLGFDYRGYGKSTGAPTEPGLYLDTQALIRCFWERLHRPGRRVVYWGRSLGGTAAAYATTIHKPDGLVLEAAFSDKQSLLNHYPVYKVLSIFSRYEFPTSRFLRGLDCPVLVIHGDRDRVVPFQQGQELFEQLSAEKYFYKVAGAGHNDIHIFSPDAYRQAVRRFIDTIEHGQDPN